MKYLKTYEANYKFKIGDYVRYIIEWLDNKQIFYKITEINKYNNKKPYLITDISNKDRWYWVEVNELIKSSEIEIQTSKYNI